jgi:hypothetical protein
MAGEKMQMRDELQIYKQPTSRIHLVFLPYHFPGFPTRLKMPNLCPVSRLQKTKAASNLSHSLGWFSGMRQFPLIKL